SDVGAGAGPYAKALAEEIVKPGVEAVTMFRNVQRRVRAAIKQEPYLGFNALGDVYLAGVPPERPQLALVPPPVTPAGSEIATRLQRSLRNYGCYHGKVDGKWSDDARQALARFARENARELENLDPTIENIMQVEGGVTAGCESPRGTQPEIAVQGCAP